MCCAECCLHFRSLLVEASKFATKSCSVFPIYYFPSNTSQCTSCCTMTMPSRFTAGNRASHGFLTGIPDETMAQARFVRVQRFLVMLLRVCV